MKYSNVSILTRSDITILMQQVDVTKAYDLLAMFKEAGNKVNLPETLDLWLSLPWLGSKYVFGWLLEIGNSSKTLRLLGKVDRELLSLYS